MEVSVLEYSQMRGLHVLIKLPLQSKVQKYASLAQKINADFLCDEENPLLENREEQELGNDIERDLHEVCWQAVTFMYPCCVFQHFIYYTLGA